MCVCVCVCVCIHSDKLIISIFFFLCRHLLDLAENVLKGTAELGEKIGTAIERFTWEGIFNVNSITYVNRLPLATFGYFYGTMNATIVGKTMTFDFVTRIYNMQRMVSDLLHKCKMAIDKVIN